MMNLATLSALLRALRQSGEGATAPVERVPHVRRVAAEGQAPLPALASATDPARRPLRALDGGLDATPAPAAATRAPFPPAPDEEGTSASIDLTRAATVVSAALRERGAQPPRPPAVEAAAPLLDSAHEPAMKLARALARSVADSGLFYESHLARWAQREYPTAALAREPQAAWIAPTPEAAAGDPMPRLPAAAATLLTRQLDALDLRQVAWSGEVWPGQRAAITFEEAGPRTDEDAQGALTEAQARQPQPWRTRIALALPALGNVEAALALSGHALTLRLAATSEDAAQRLAHASPQLAGALAASHLALAGFAVERVPAA